MISSLTEGPNRSVRLEIINKNIGNYNIYCDRLEIINKNIRNYKLCKKKQRFLKEKHVNRKQQQNSLGFIIICVPAGRPPERHQCCKTTQKVRLASLAEADETSPAPPGAPKSPQGAPKATLGTPNASPRAPKSSPRHSSRDKHYIKKNSRSTAGRPVC